jgi:hypothetical protein
MTMLKGVALRDPFFMPLMVPPAFGALTGRAAFLSCRALSV